MQSISRLEHCIFNNSGNAKPISEAFPILLKFLQGHLGKSFEVYSRYSFGEWEYKDGLYLQTISFTHRQLFINGLPGENPSVVRQDYDCFSFVYENGLLFKPSLPHLSSHDLLFFE